nr:sulfatase [uncultured Hyphomonas sp.]
MTETRPNILFIVADDLNAWIGALGRHPQTRTPNIDRLAARGANFTHAYCSAPYCNASRMSVFTGMLPPNNGVYQNEPFWGSDRRRPTYFEALREQGYACHGAGKVFHGTFDYATAGRTRAPLAGWRPAHPHDEVWDHFDHSTAEPMPPNRPLNGMFNFDRFDEVSPWNHLFDWGILPEDREAETPDALTVSAAERLLAAPPADKPFLFAAGLYKPHLPWYAPQRFFDMFPLDKVIVPVVRDDDLDDVPPIARQWALNPPDHETVTRAGQWRHAVRGYLAAIAYCDEQIGRLIDAVDASPAADNTIIVLWGDNGFHLGEKLHWRKFVLWEEATRVPFIVVPPARAGIAPARLRDPSSLIDLFPTLFDMAGLDPLPGVDGTSLLPLIRGETLPPRPAVTTWQKGNHSIRFGHWRYTRYRDGTENSTIRPATRWNGPTSPAIRNSRAGGPRERL